MGAEGDVTPEESLRRYITMIEDFLARRTTVEDFSTAFFKAFQNDRTHWGGDLYEALNDVQTACECYDPGEPLPNLAAFHMTEQQLRGVCDRRIVELRAHTRPNS